MLKAILFDMDGVLVNTEPVHFEANVKLLKEMGVTLSYDYYKQFIGSTNPYMWTCMKEKFSLEPSVQELIDSAEIEKNRIKMTKGLPPIEGVYDFVRALKKAGYKLAVASSSPMSNIEYVIDYFGIRDCFDELVSGIDCKHPKPAPDVFLKASEKLNVQPQDCLVIEDSQNGTLAAKAAKMACLGFINKDSGDQDLRAADYLVETFIGLEAEFAMKVYCYHHRLPYTVITTNRLRIREASLDDIDEFYKIYDDRVTKYMEPLYEDKDQEISYTKAYIDNMYRFYGYGIWAIERIEDNKIIGRAGLSNRMVNDSNEVELGFMIGYDFQRNGYAYEACTAIIEYAKNELGINKLNLFTHPDNIAGNEMAKKLGFTQIGNGEADGKEYIFYEKSLI